MDPLIWFHGSIIPLGGWAPNRIGYEVIGENPPFISAMIHGHLEGVPQPYLGDENEKSMVMNNVSVTSWDDDPPSTFIRGSLEDRHFPHILRRVFFVVDLRKKKTNG